MKEAFTNGVHHVGLTVSRLAESAAFFLDVLGWTEVRRDDTYPAIFVSDGVNMITLWQAQTQTPVAFSKAENVGLHHIAFSVASLEKLKALHQKLLSASMEIEFAPELLRQGPAKHMMCYEPSGIRVEFIWPGI
ncbi:MAG: VOC family protein [Gammaproteobacteria bacterium]|nr:VOC family protein [Gammaproteobacteria bacterium]